MRDREISTAASDGNTPSVSYKENCISSIYFRKANTLLEIKKLCQIIPLFIRIVLVGAPHGYWDDTSEHDNCQNWKHNASKENRNQRVLRPKAVSQNELLHTFHFVGKKRSCEEEEARAWKPPLLVRVPFFALFTRSFSINT